MIDRGNPDLVVSLPGPPRGKGRPRMRVVQTRKTSFAQVYTDAKTRNYEGMLRQAASQEMLGVSLFTGPLAVEVVAVFAVPASWSRKKQTDAASGIIRPTGKPDADNIGKEIDSCNGIIWQDDAQVVDLEVHKYYGKKPCLMIKVWALTPTDCMRSHPESSSHDSAGPLFGGSPATHDERPQLHGRHGVAADGRKR